jgi:hypothetical protein
MIEGRRTFREGNPLSCIPQEIDGPTAANIVALALEHYAPSPDRYPLPRAPNGVAWCRVNLACCMYVSGWSEWQKPRDMAAIIPALEALAA